MDDHMLNLRRFFRNRFERYASWRDYAAAVDLDGLPLTLRELCQLLTNDHEPFPRHYDRDMRKVCGYHYGAWQLAPRTYGDVAKLIDRLLATEDGRLSRPSGMWVHEMLNSNNIALRQ